MDIRTTTADGRVKAGVRVVFRRLDGVMATDIVRAVFTQTILLQPYADNAEVEAVVLTSHSWCAVEDITEVCDGEAQA